MSAAKRALWAVTALHVAFLLAWSLLSPTFRPPDEAEHVDMVLTVRRTLSWPNFDRAQMSEAVVRARHVIGEVEFDRRGPRTAAEALPRSERPAFGELGTFAGTSEPNQLANHPPLYYAVTGAVSATIDTVWPGTLTFDQSVWVMRLTSIALIAPLPLLAWATARWMRAGEDVALAAAVFPLVIPQLSHIGAAVNNDNLLTLAFGILTLLLAEAWSGNTSPGTAVTVGLVGVVALLAKGFALVLPVWIVGAYLLAWWRTRSREALSSGALALGVSAVGGGWWWVRNLIVFGDVQPAISTVGPPPADFEPSFAWWWPRFRTRLENRWWGQFGYFDTILPGPAIRIPTIVTGVGVLGSFLERTRRHRWAEVLLLLYPVLSIGALVFYGAWRAYLRTSLTPGIQGRYLFPGVVGVAVVVAMGLAVLLRGASRYLPLGLVVGAGVMQALGFHRVLDAYWGAPPVPSLGSSLRAVLAWAPIPGVLTVLIAVGLVGSLAWALAATARFARSRPSGRVIDRSTHGRHASVTS